MEMNLLPSIFSQIVHLEHYRRLQANGRNVGYTMTELEHRIARRLEAMTQLRGRAGVFVMREYSKRVRQLLAEAESADDMTQIFTEYCRFQCQVFMLEHYPYLVALFRSVGLHEWATLTVDRETLYPFAETLIRSLNATAAELYETTTTDPEDAHVNAELITLTADLFGINLSSGLRRLVDWYMSTAHDQGCSPIWLRSREGLREITS